jgi:hypothetical protein
MSDDDKTVYLHDVIRDDIVGRRSADAEARGQRADPAALRRAVEAEMTDSRSSRRAH